MDSAGPSGLHGKFPARGDFVTRNLPGAFVSPWDQWLQAGVAASRDQLGETWLSLYLESPIWRFVLAPGVCGPESWAGVLMPSVDKVGRYFPLTIAAPLAATVPLVAAVTAGSWFESAEALAVRALEDDHLDLEQFVGEVAGLTAFSSSAPAPAPTGGGGSDAGVWCTSIATAGAVGEGLAVFLDRLLVDRGDSYTLWWTNGGTQVPAHSCILPHLPSADRFCHFLTGSVGAVTPRGLQPGPLVTS